MKILTWRERHKPGIRAATDPTIAELMQAEIDELRAALKAQPVQPAPKGYFEEQPDGTVIPVDPSEMQPAPLADAEERADFEAWIAKDGGDIRTFGIGANTHYQNSAVNNSWQGWKRRAITKVRTGGAG